MAVGGTAAARASLWLFTAAESATAAIIATTRIIITFSRAARPSIAQFRGMDRRMDGRMDRRTGVSEGPSHVGQRRSIRAGETRE